MSSRVDLEAIIDSHIADWSDIPCALILDNTPSRSDDYAEWIRMTIVDGDSFVQESAGLLDVRGSTDANPFILVFDIFTPKNIGTGRSAQIFQNIKNHWGYKSLGDVLFDAVTYDGSAGEEQAIYHKAAIISAVRYETLEARS